MTDLSHAEFTLIPRFAQTLAALDVYHVLALLGLQGNRVSKSRFSPVDAGQSHAPRFCCLIFAHNHKMHDGSALEIVSASPWNKASMRRAHLR
jgi:hypothetical protein